MSWTWDRTQCLGLVGLGLEGYCLGLFRGLELRPGLALTVLVPSLGRFHLKDRLFFILHFFCLVFNVTGINVPVLFQPTNEIQLCM